jgi:hypothetical protein
MTASFTTLAKTPPFQFGRLAARSEFHDTI